MGYFKTLKNHWLSILTCTIFFFWVGFFVTEYIYNNNFTTYSVEVETAEISEYDVDLDFFLDALYKETIVDEKGNEIKVYSYATVNITKIFKERDIKVVPLTYTMDGTTYVDMEGLSAKEFFAKLREGKMSVTSQVNPDEAREVMQEEIKGHKTYERGEFPWIMIEK